MGTAVYDAIRQSTVETDSAPFISFMLGMILQTVDALTPQVGELLAVVTGEMGREALQTALGLSDRKSFRERYLTPALAAGLIEMTVPEKPTSRLQKYRLSVRGHEWLREHRE